MKKRVLTVCALVCVLFSGCSQTDKETPQSTQGPSQTETEDQVFTQTQSDSLQTRLQYYEELVKKLEGELLQTKTEQYMEKLQYESRLESLKDELAAMEELKEQTPPIPLLPFTYRIENGGVILTSYVGNAQRVEIPDTVEGLPVIALGDRLFENCVSVREIVIPSGVTAVGWFAFSGCVSLQTVEIPQSVNVMSYGVFENCPATLTVRCVKSSYAEAYAKSYGIRTVS